MNSKSSANELKNDPFPPKKNRNWRKHTSFAVGFIYFVALSIGLLYIVPSLFSAERYKHFALKVVSKALKTDIDAQSVDIYFLGGLGVSLKNVRIAHKKRPSVMIKEIKASINLWESIKGKLSINELKLISPVIRLVKKRDGTYNIPFLNQIKQSAQTTDSTKMAAGLLSIFDQITFINTTFSWQDKSVALTPVKAAFSDVDLQLTRGSREGPLSLIFSGVLHSKGVATELKLSGGLTHYYNGKTRAMDLGFNGRGYISKCNLNTFWPYISPFVPFQKLDAQISWTGVFKGSFTRGFKSKGTLGLYDLGIEYVDVFSKVVKPHDAIIDYDITGGKETLYVNMAKAVMGPMEIEANGNIYRFDTQNPLFKVVFSTNQIDVEELKGFLPDKALTTQQSSFLKNNLRKGAIAFRHFTFDGSLEDIRNLNENRGSLKVFRGALFLSDMEVAFRKLSFPLDDISGLISLTPDRLIISNLKGSYGSSQIEELSGELINIHDWPGFNIHIRANLNLLEAKQLLSFRLTSPEFKEHVKNMEDIEGELRWDLTLAGNTKDPVQSLEMDGKILFDKVSFTHKSFGLPIVGLSGEMDMNLSNINFSNITWTAGASPFEITGIIHDVFKERPTFDVTILSSLDLDDIDKVNLITTGDIHSHSGQALVKLRLNGDFKEFEIDQWLDMTETRYRFDDFLKKPMGLANRYSFKGSVKDRKKITIDKLIVDLGESRVVMTGKVDEFLRGEGLDLTFQSDGVLIDDLDQILVEFDDIDSGGYIKGWLSLKKGEDNAPLQGTGLLVADNADFKLPFFSAAFREVDAIFELTGDRIFLYDGHGRFGKGEFDVTANGYFDTKPTFTFNVNAQRIDLLDFIGEDQYINSEDREEEENDPDDEPNYFASGTWNIVGVSKEGQISYISYEDLAVTIQIKDDVFHIAPLSFTAYDGFWRWGGDVTLLDDNMVRFESEIDIRDLSVEKYLKEAYGVEELIYGKMNLRGTTSSRGSGWESLKRGMNGAISMNMEEGVIRRFNVLSKIFSLLNVSQYFRLKAPDLAVQGMTHNGIMANYVLTDGVASTSDLVIDSEAMRIAASGDYDLVTTEVNMAVAVSPFVAIDRVVSALPIVGYVLAGEEHSFVTAHYAVTGPISWTDVEALPFLSIANGLAGMVKRLFLLPVKAVELLSSIGQKPVGNNNDNN